MMRHIWEVSISTKFFSCRQLNVTQVLHGHCDQKCPPSPLGLRVSLCLQTADPGGHLSLSDPLVRAPRSSLQCASGIPGPACVHSVMFPVISGKLKSPTRTWAVLNVSLKQRDDKGIASKSGISTGTQGQVYLRVLKM